MRGKETPVTIRIVTDSTSDISRDMANEFGITVVAQNVHFGACTFKDNVTITPEKFYRTLNESPEQPTTSQASPGEFQQVYDNLGEEADGIVSIHISSRISGTYGSALMGAASSSAACPVEVIDSGQATMGLGLAVIAAAQAARRGAGFGEVVSAARGAVARAQCLCLFETLEYLQKGQRIGKARVLLSSMARIKPVVTMRDGELHPGGRARTFHRGLATMKQAARVFAPVQSLAVMHAGAPEAAAEVAADLKDLLPSGAEPVVTSFGPAIGVHTGPGAIGIALLQADTENYQ